MLRKVFPSLIWTGALVLLFIGGEGPSLCIFKWMGFNSCPGCGLGHSIHYLLHGQVEASFNEHILGIPVLVALMYLIIQPFLSIKPN